MRDDIESSPFETVPTQVPGLDSGLLWVRESLIREDSVLARGTTLLDFLPEANKGNALDRGFGSYVLTLAQQAQNGWRPFWFAKVRTAEEIAVAFDTEEQVRQGIYWPAVLSTVDSANLLAYTADSDTYVAGTAYKFNYALQAYDGPTKVLIEYFASHTKPTIAAASGMQPRGGALDYAIGSITVPECLHGALTLSYQIPDNHPSYEGKTFSVTIPATVPTMRPSSFVISDGYKFMDGLYIQRRETAYAP